MSHLVTTIVYILFQFFNRELRKPDGMQNTCFRPAPQKWPMITPITPIWYSIIENKYKWPIYKKVAKNYFIWSVLGEHSSPEKLESIWSVLWVLSRKFMEHRRTLQKSLESLTLIHRVKYIVWTYTRYRSEPVQFCYDLGGLFFNFSQQRFYCNISAAGSRLFPPTKSASLCKTP